MARVIVNKDTYIGSPIASSAIRNVANEMAGSAAYATERPLATCSLGIV